MRRRLLLLAPVVMMLAGCAAPQPSIGFGESADSHTVQCVHLRRGERVLIGDTVTNRGGAVTLRSASLRDAQGMTVLQAWVLTNPGGTSIGVTDIPPPPGLGWASRVVAAGAVIRAHTVRDVVLEVERSAETAGSATGIRLQVSSGGRRCHGRFGDRLPVPDRLQRAAVRRGA